MKLRQSKTANILQQSYKRYNIHILQHPATPPKPVPSPVEKGGGICNRRWTY